MKNSPQLQYNAVGLQDAAHAHEQEEHEQLEHCGVLHETHAVPPLRAIALTYSDISSKVADFIIGFFHSIIMFSIITIVPFHCITVYKSQNSKE